MIEVYTDGSCLGNPGTGGWAFLILREDEDINHFGFQQNTTNNQMELTATIKALEYIKENDEITIFTDSSYVKNGITSWIINWKKNNWKNAAKKNVKNKELWIELDKYQDKHDVRWHWVKGHSGHAKNEIADQLANKGIDTL